MPAVARCGSQGAFFILLTGWVCAAANAQAEQPGDESTRAAAREIGYSGIGAFERGDYALARERLDKAYAILRAPSLGLWSARTLVKVGKLVEAHERYLEVSRLPTSMGDEAVQLKARDEAAAEELALAPRVPRLIVRITDAPASTVTVTVDGGPLVAALWGESRPINPGRHLVRATADGTSAQEAVVIEEGEQKTVVLSLAQVPAPERDEPVAIGAPPPATRAPDSDAGHDLAARTPRARLLAWAALAVGGAGLVVGAVAGASALSERQELRGNPACAGTACGVGATDDVNRYNHMRVASSVALVAGAGLAAIGTLLMLTVPASSDGAPAESSLSLTVSPVAAFVRARF
jgi:hypothetical protein